MSARRLPVAATKANSLGFGEVAQLAHAEPVGIGKHLQEDHPAARLQYAAGGRALVARQG
jgi:hypothetical protein